MEPSSIEQAYLGQAGREGIGGGPRSKEHHGQEYRSLEALSKKGDLPMAGSRASTVGEEAAGRAVGGRG